jgi:hypothetical protein
MSVPNLPSLPHPPADGATREYMQHLVNALDYAIGQLNRGEPLKNNVIGGPTGSALAAGDHLIFEGQTWRNYPSATDTITSGTTQTQAGATALTATYNRVTIHGSTDDGVKLPTAIPGRVCVVHNDTATIDLQVWPNTSDAIEGAAADAVGVTKLAAGVVHQYVAADITTWYLISVTTPP